MTIPAAEIGSTASSYQLLAKLATGGMAEIFLARGASVAGVARHVVLKRVLRERANDFHFVRMFLDEARLAAQLQHPNIAQVYDVGKLGDSYFFTMEFVHGETVRALIHRAQRESRFPPLPCVLAIAAGTAAGLHHAHERIGVDGRQLGIVHRDVSPSNLMVSFEGNVKVVDFGVAKASHRVHETQSGTIKGKIAYLSPEQAMGRDVDPRSDVFSLGIVLWELLTGQRLYKRDSDFEAMAAIVHEPPPAPSLIRGDVPAEVDTLVLRALAKDRDHRFQTAQELLDSIEAIGARYAYVMTAGSLARFMRELFGTRPEPWIALQALDAPPEAVTLTAEPIPKDLAFAATSPVDARIASLVDLSTQWVDDETRQLPRASNAADRERPLAPPTAIDSRTLTPADHEQPTTVLPAHPTGASPRFTPMRILAPAIAIGIGVGIALAFRTSDVAPRPVVAGAQSAADAVPAHETSLVDALEPAAVTIDAPHEPAIATDPVAPSDPGTPEVDGGAPMPVEIKREVERDRPRVRAPSDDDVISACRARDRAKALRLFAKLAPQRKARVASKCNMLGVELEKPKRPDCDADPGRCQD